jgi:hypothetical protein
MNLLSKVVFMIQEKRFGLSAAQKSDMWCRWRAGQSLHEIGRAFGKNHSSIRCLVSHHGGFVPAVRRRSLLALTQREHKSVKMTIGGAWAWWLNLNSPGCNQFRGERMKDS